MAVFSANEIRTFFKLAVLIIFGYKYLRYPLSHFLDLHPQMVLSLVHFGALLASFLDIPVIFKKHNMIVNSNVCNKNKQITKM